VNHYTESLQQHKEVAVFTEELTDDKNRFREVE
jgi:hypothetical protein